MSSSPAPLHLVSTVFYDPNLFHYISSGWDIDELLSCRVRTSTSTFAPLSLPITPSAEEGDASESVYTIGASKLRRAALRALLLHDADMNGASCDNDGARRNGSTIKEESKEAVMDSLEAALDQWMPFTHLHVHGARRPAAGKSSSTVCTAPSQIVIVDDTPPGEKTGEGDPQSVLAAARSQLMHQNFNKKSESAAQQSDSGADRGAPQYPLVIPATSGVAVPLVLTFVKDAHTWRKLRHAARSAASPQTNATADSVKELNNKVEATAAETEEQRASAPLRSALFVSDDDALFTQWLQSKSALRQQWRSQIQTFEPGACNTLKSPNPNALLQHASVSPSSHSTTLPSHKNAEQDNNSTSSSTDTSDEDEAQQPCKTATAKDSVPQANAEARRAAILAAIERRRKK